MNQLPTLTPDERAELEIIAAAEGWTRRWISHEKSRALHNLMRRGLVEGSPAAFAEDAYWDYRATLEGLRALDSEGTQS